MHPIFRTIKEGLFESLGDFELGHVSCNILVAKFVFCLFFISPTRIYRNYTDTLLTIYVYEIGIVHQISLCRINDDVKYL